MEFKTVDELIAYCKTSNLKFLYGNKASPDLITERLFWVLLNDYPVTLKDVLESDTNKSSEYDLLIINNINRKFDSSSNNDKYILQKILNIYRGRKDK